MTTVTIEVIYAEERGIWHLLEREDGAEAVTLCEQRFVEASIHRLDFKPKPLCHRCRERRRGPKEPGLYLAASGSGTVSTVRQSGQGTLAVLPHTGNAAIKRHDPGRLEQPADYLPGFAAAPP